MSASRNTIQEEGSNVCKKNIGEPFRYYNCCTVLRDLLKFDHTINSMYDKIVSHRKHSKKHENSILVPDAKRKESRVRLKTST